MVSAGERAVLVTWGNPDMIPKSEGLHFKIPIAQSAVIMDVKTQKYQADLTAASKDLQDVKTTIAINYHIVPEDAAVIYKEIGLDYADKVIYPLEQETNKGITAQYTAEELITKREEVREKMKSSLREKLLPRGITVEEISIVNFEFSESFTLAIEAKVTAEQNALAAKNKLEQIKYEAQQIEATATAEAMAIKIKGDALRENPQLVQLEAVKKWNGIMPIVTGGGTPFLDLRSITQTASNTI
jgi:regulator of protease activity HflC (stomatin/prohibitin superfamily)